ncbi:hypothetical protein [Roseicyclus persicicus]|uniref:Uncharacterized protein n=1 Tax=Roseicyclus persicicus TaxID=2650661 RepID=A0A7X6GYM7_9RHOB|nr:hypothetical protein [Roseibacterium persicicum]NKX44074.1 hypothetical protein [Roseibacterium persicicum]
MTDQTPFAPARGQPGHRDLRQAALRVGHAAGAAGLLALAAALSLGLPARAQGTAVDLSTPLGQAVALCTDPMTTGAAKAAQVAASGWTRVAAEDADLAALAGAHVGSILGEDAPVPAMLELVPQLAANFGALVAAGDLGVWTQGGAILALAHADGADGERLSCYFAGPAGAGIEGYWDTATAPEPMPQSGTVGTIFSGTVTNTRDGLTYDEYQLYLRVADDLTALPESFRYERLEVPAQ